MKKLFLIFILTGTVLFSQNKKTPKIVVSPEVFNFGKIVEGTVVNKEFEIKNIGNDTLKIEKVQASCGCTAASPKKKLLLPGETTTVLVSFDSANRKGNQKKHVYIFTNDPQNAEFRFSFLAEVVSAEKDESNLNSVPQLKLNRYTYDFGKIYEGEKLKLSINYENIGDEILEIKNVKTSCDCTATVLERQKLNPGEEGKIDITFDTSGRIGKMARTISLFSNDPKNPEQTITLFVNIIERNS